MANTVQITLTEDQAYELISALQIIKRYSDPNSAIPKGMRKAFSSVFSLGTVADLTTIRTLIKNAVQDTYVTFVR